MPVEVRVEAAASERRLSVRFNRWHLYVLATARGDESGQVGGRIEIEIEGAVHEALDGSGKQTRERWRPMDRQSNTRGFSRTPSGRVVWRATAAAEQGKAFRSDRAAANSSLGDLAKSTRGAGQIADGGVFEGLGDIAAGPASPVCGSSVQGWVAGGICLMSAADFS
jgi:hypothetical protein